MEGADGTSINTNPQIYTCEVGMRRKNDIKGRGGHKKWGGEHSVIKFVTEFKNNI